MNILQFEKSSCQNCYKCIRNCDVKAIRYQDSLISINEKDCILCGECVNVCPTHAKHVKEDVFIVKDLIEHHDHVVVSLAPSYKAYFENIEYAVMSRALKALGFHEVQETALGAGVVNEAYVEYIQKHKQKHYITTACFSTVLLVEKFYPKLVDYLLPVDSPLMAHAKMLKKENPNRKVVFIGPCVSKKGEAENVINKGVIDAVLTFEDLEKWMHEIGVIFEKADSEAIGLPHPITRIYPKSEGVLESLSITFPHPYTMLSVNGIAEVRALFDLLESDETLPPYFIEAHICEHSCLGGPIIRSHNHLPAITRHYLHTEKTPEDARVAGCVDYKKDVDLRHLFFARTLQEALPSEEIIQSILNSTGKFTVADEINCGCCGYPTCRDKAIAVYQKKADINMCMPYFKQKAESLSNMIIEYSPNAIFVLNEECEVQEINRSAELLFNIEKKEVMHECLPMFLREEIFHEAKTKNQSIRKKIYFPEINKICHVSATYIEVTRYFLTIVQDISEMEAQKQAMIVLRQQTIDATSRVIEKQMRVAQEIASLLGETTAETKVTLTKLKKIMEDEGFTS